MQRRKKGVSDGNGAKKPGRPQIKIRSPPGLGGGGGVGTEAKLSRAQGSGEGELFHRAAVKGDGGNISSPSGQSPRPKGSVEQAAPWKIVLCLYSGLYRGGREGAFGGRGERLRSFLGNSS